MAFNCYKRDYVSPEMELQELDSEAVLCTSGYNEDYQYINPWS